MKLRFGPHLDGQHGTQSANRIGLSDVGPLGLAGILETQLGLSASLVTSAERCVQYRDCLIRLDSSDRFFHESLAKDDFGVAVELLNWRDTWRLHGWNGSVPVGDVSPRLADMASVEDLATTMVAPGLAERLAEIAKALGHRKHLIESIELVTPIESLPRLWQAVLKQLPCNAVVVEQTFADSTLGNIQKALSSIGGSKPLDWKDDGSLVVARSETVVTGARWLAETIRQQGEDVLYVATSAAQTTDAYLAASDHPRQGLSDASAFRPALQLLPLTLELLWAPVNFHALVQFLTHPISPIPARARRKLAGIQTDYPGVGGSRWKTILEALAEDYGELAGKVRETIAFWIEHKRYDPASGVPVDVLLERVQRLTEYFRNSPGDASPALRQAYASGFSQCLAFAENLSRLHAQGVELLRPRQAEQLSSQSTARGNDNPLRVAEVGSIHCINHPGAAIAQHGTVVWGPLDAPPLPALWPWSKSEIASLDRVGCRLPDPGDLLQQEAGDWLKPLLAARDKLVLLSPPLDHEIHPIWQAIEALFESVPIIPVESLFCGADGSLDIVPARPLPAIKRWWQLPEGTALPSTGEYSYSQLEKQIFNPYHWLLSYAARLRSGSLLSIADDFRLKGLLAHSLVERFYEAAGGGEMADTDFNAWFNPAFDRLITEEGAVFLMPGRRTDLENLRLTLRRALVELRSLLHRAGVSLVEAERQLAGQFPGGILAGKSDLVLTKPKGDLAIVDLKWSGNTHRDRLSANRHLQLAIYAELLRQNTNRWPSVAYFLLSQATLLTRDDGWFPSVTPVADATGENTAQLWLRFLETWQWRQAQFAEGHFEVVLEESDEPESQPPPDGLVIETLNTSYNECLHLAGWGEQA
jgi:hypothetical protein